MRLVRLFLAFAVLVVLGWSPGAAEASLIVNGSFEDPPFSSGIDYAYIPGGETSISGWETIHTGVERIALSTYGGGSGFGSAHDGLVSLDLNTDHGVGGGIQQSVPTDVGGLYSLTFWQGTYNHHGRDGTSNVIVSAGATTESFFFENHNPIIAWGQKTLNFTATSTTTLISFENFDSPELNFSHIDNVSINLVPEPSTALLLGIGLVRMSLRKKGRGF